jgi:hypothetical protein
MASAIGRERQDTAATTNIPEDINASKEPTKP